MLVFFCHVACLNWHAEYLSLAVPLNCLPCIRPACSVFIYLFVFNIILLTGWFSAAQQCVGSSPVAAGATVTTHLMTWCWGCAWALSESLSHTVFSSTRWGDWGAGCWHAYLNIHLHHIPVTHGLSEILSSEHTHQYLQLIVFNKFFFF